MKNSFWLPIVILYVVYPRSASGETSEPRAISNETKNVDSSSARTIRNRIARAELSRKSLPSTPISESSSSERAPADQEPTLVQAPKLLKLVPAVIPKDTVFPTPEVVVVLEIDVDAQGQVTQVKLAKGVGQPFDNAALEACKKFKFEPARLSNGDTVPVTITFRMRITEPPPPPPPAVEFSGRLLERGTRLPLAGVDLTVVATNGEVLQQVMSDAQGRFRIAVRQKRFRLEANPATHEKLRIDVEAVFGEKRQEVFYLESTQNEFETVVRAQRIQREVTKRVIPKQVVEKIAGTQGDTLKVVQNLPGSARSPFLGGQLILRGASPGDSRVFIEGQEIPVLYHFGGLRSTFNSTFLDSVEFVPGNFVSDYGRAIGGMVEVKVRDLDEQMLRGEVDVNLYDAGFRLEGPLSKHWTLGGAFHRSWVDTFISAVIPEDAGLSFNTAPRYYDYQILTTYKPNANQKLRIMAFGSLDRLALLFERPAGDPLVRGALQGRIMFHNLQLLYFHRFSPNLFQETSLQLGYQEINTAIGPQIFFDLGIYRLSLRSSWTYRVADWFSLRAGLDFRLDRAGVDANSPLRPVEGENLPPLSTQTFVGVNDATVLFEPAVFVEMSFQPTDKLTLVPSARVDYYRSIDRWTVDPRLVVSYRILPSTTLKGGVGYFQQPPSPDQVLPEFGNPNLFAPRSTHSSLGVEQRFAEGLDLEITGFYKWLDRQVIRNPAFFSDTSSAPYLNGGTGRIIGLEVLLRAQLGGFQGWLAYTFQRSFRKDGPGSEERPFDFDQPHILTLVGSYQFAWGVSASARFRLVSGNPETPIIGAIFDSNSGTWVPVFGKNNAERLPTFHQLDLRVDKTFTFDLWKLSVYLEVVNAYNRGNVEMTTYNYDYSEKDHGTGLPILPIFGIKGEW